MMDSRRLGAAELVQIIEVHGPTHDADWMLPGISHESLDHHHDWLTPAYYMPITNRLVFSFQLFVLRAGAATIVIDSGIGNCKCRPTPWHNMINTPAIEWFEAIGMPPASVTHVVHTHLHGDHVGWNTRLVDGRWEPTFPNAEHCLPAIDWHACKSRYDAGEHDLYGGAIADSVIPIVDAGLARFIRPGDEIADCLTVLPAPGHTPGHVLFSFRDGGRNAIFTGDVLHSPLQIYQPDVNSRWCEFPADARASRRRVLRDAARDGSTIFAAHAKSLAGWHVADRAGDFTLVT